MDNIFLLREHIQILYSRHSKVIDRVIQFVLALAAFYLINKNVGFMKIASSPVVTLAFAVICTFLPLIVTVVFATLLILVHMYAVSLSTVLVTALIFLIMYIFYLRLTPKMALIVLITPLLFALKIPYIIPVACALLAAPASLAAVLSGTVIYYMMAYVKKTAPGLKGTGNSGLMTQMTSYIKQVFQNKEMWIIIIAFVICFFVVYTIRKQSMDHAWKIAVIAGAVVNVVVIAAGDIALGIHTSYGPLIGGSVCAILVGLVLELFFYSVDYARSETLQYEDDEYYYFVKAIPKVAITTPEKTVKRINERRETEIIDTDEVRRKSRIPQGRQPVSRNQAASQMNSRAQAQKGAGSQKHIPGNTEKLLLTQSLKDELKINLKDDR